MKRKIEIWADSFHEGEWCCDHLEMVAKASGYLCDKTYKRGFIPQYCFEKTGQTIVLKVYGSYSAWSGLPEKIRELLDWGKPDFIAYDPEGDKILFAVEETSATMTGNQPVQRCERQYGSALYKIPYWYLVSEFGRHLDGGIRRDSIWPSISALKLSIHFQTPSIVLHYSGENAPEDYESGRGLSLLFDALFQWIEVFAVNKDPEILMDIMSRQYEEMLDFINSQWRNMIDFIPNQDLLQDKRTARRLAYCGVGRKEEIKGKLDGFLQWPLTTEVEEDKKIHWKRSDLLTFDPLSELLETDIELKNCYILSGNASSGRPPTQKQVIDFLKKQKEAFEKGGKMNPPAFYNLKLSSFSKTSSGNYNLTTSKNILYLYDNSRTLKNTIVKAYGRLQNRLNAFDKEVPAIVYISNSLAPRRIFGDPFVGQLAAYAIIFGKFDQRKRLVVAYYPHQSYTYYKEAKGKGKKIVRELADYIIFAGGVAICTATEEVY